MLKVGQRMLAWQYLDRCMVEKNAQKILKLDMTAAVRTALQSDEWVQVIGIGAPSVDTISAASRSLATRNRIAYTILDEVIGIFAHLNDSISVATRKRQFPAELEVAWWDWHEVAVLDTAFTAVYRR